MNLGGTEIEIAERGTDSPYPWLTKAGNMLLAARAGHLQGIGVGESASMTVELDNSDKQASALLGYCLRARAWFYDGDDVFPGLIQQIEVGHPLILTLEA